MGGHNALAERGRNREYLHGTVADVPERAVFHRLSWSAPGGTAPGTVQDVSVCNNFFCESVYYPVQVSTGGNVTVADNLFDRIGTRPDPMNPRCAVRVTCSQDVTVRNNWMLPFAKRFTVMNTREADGRWGMDLTDFFREPCKHG